jgi:hypothetical protein
MDYYEISKEYWSTIQKFATLQDAQTFADNLGTGYNVEYVAPYTAPTIEERLDSDINFGNELVKTFVHDNRESGTTQAQNDALLIKFRDILAFAQTGSVESIQTHLPNITIDEVFTQARKDKYIEMVNVYLNQF